MSITYDRNLDTNTNAEFKRGLDGSEPMRLIAAPILYLKFDSLTKYYSGASVDINLNSDTIMPIGVYVGVGGISSISASEESTELKANKITVELNGLNSQYIALVLAENYYGREAKLGLVTLDSNYNVIGEPLLLFKGFMSVLTADIEKNAKITVEIESILSDWERPRIKRYNSPTQSEVDSTDKGFDNVGDLINKEVIWGR